MLITTAPLGFTIVPGLWWVCVHIECVCVHVDESMVDGWMGGWMDGWIIQALLLLAIAILLVTFLLCALASPVTKDIASGFPCLAKTL